MNSYSLSFCFVFLTTFISSSILYAQQPGDLDGSFGSVGIVTTPLKTISEEGMSVTSLSDDHIIVGGLIRPTYTTADFALMKFKPNGNIDSNFGINGLVTTYIEDRSQAQDLVVQSDNRILLGGYSKWNINLVRYLDNGVLDSAFGMNGKVITDIPGYYSDKCNALQLQPDGKILVIGYAQHNSNDKPYFALARYHSNGSIDSAFGINGFAIGIPGRAYAGYLLSDGKILVSGSSDSQFTTMRFSGQGDIDSTFGTNGVVKTQLGNLSECKAIQVQDNGKIVVAGYADSLVALARYHSDGTNDMSFGTNGVTTSSVGRAESLFIQDDGKLIVAGSTSSFSTIGRGSNSEFLLLRFTSNGAPDIGFGIAGRVTTTIGTHSKGSAIDLQDDGKILLAGSSSDSCGTSFTITRYHGDPSLGIPERNINGQEIRVFPNPMRDEATIEFETLQELVEIELYDTQGRMLLSVQDKSAIQTRINTESLPAGMYVLLVKTSQLRLQCVKVCIKH